MNLARWKKHFVCLAAALAAITVRSVSAAGTPPASTTPENTMRLVEGVNRFATKIFNLDIPERENLLFSPLSVYGALTIAYAGARGSTAEGFDRALEYGLEADRLHPTLGNFLAELGDSAAGDQLRLVSRLWGQDGHEFLPEYLKLVGKHYRAAFGRVDFRRPEKARAGINRWVAEQTGERIRDLVPPGVITALTRLMIVNAVYFRADWRTIFPEEETEPAPFFPAAGGEAEVDLMRVTDDFRYLEKDGLQAVELPYSGERLAMTVILPDPETEPARLFAGVCAADPLLRPRTWPRRRVEVFLPRFRTESRLRLDEALKALGMEEAFSEGADFSGIDGTEDLFISAVLHQAWIEVDETGTEAAAATAVGIGVTAVPAPPAVFRADRPFTYLIRDRESGAVLFWGRFDSPAERQE